VQKYESIKTALTTSVLQTHSRAGIVSAVRKNGYSGERANTLAARVQVLGAEGEIARRRGSAGLVTLCAVIMYYAVK